MSKDCSKVKTIEEVTELWEHEDKVGGGQNDSKWVSCGQDGSTSGYSELKKNFDRNFKGITNESWMAKLMCQCCKKLKPTGKEKVTWLEFYKCLESKVTNETPNTLSKINDLIKWHESRT